MQKKPQHYFKSRVFIRLFLSYAVLIFAFLALYAGWYVYTYQKDYAEAQQQAMRQKAAALGTLMDQQLITAQQQCAAVNNSENCRDIFQSVYVEKKAVDAMQLYKAINEIKRVKGASSNMNIYSLVLTFQGDSRAFTPGAVIPTGGSARMLAQHPWIGVNSVAELTGLSGGTNVIINKEFFIYADNYTAFSATSPKGTVMVLFDRSSLASMVWSALGDAAGMRILWAGEDVFQLGTETALVFPSASLVLPDLTYQVFAQPGMLQPSGLLMDAMLPLVVIALMGVIFLCVTYRVAKHYYQPIGHIGQMIERTDQSRNEIDSIMDGIRSLIGERNGYREKMITISPYARQGMLHSMLNGKMRNERLEVLIDEQFVELSKMYFTLGIINVGNVGRGEVTPQQYRDAQELISHVAQEMSTDECTVVCCMRSLQELFVIANSNEETELEPLFYQMYDRVVEVLDNASLAVTIGVSARERDLERLPEACRSAERALEQMLTGGRSSVYFDDAGADQGSGGYYFPKDALKRMIKGVREGSAQELNALLDDIYQRNVREMELSPAEMRLMLDELHLTVRNALQEVFELSTTHVRVERIREAATVDEIFNYYRQVLDMALAESGKQLIHDSANELEAEICAYLEANLFSPELSLNGMADRFGVSTKMIGLVCKKHYGQTFLSYVRNRQIHHAVELLQTTDLLLEDIAQQCGFTNLLTFRRNFKAVMNMNPSDFRR